MPPSCLGAGNGKINQPADTPIPPLGGYLWLDKSGSSDAFDIADGALTITGTGHGTWTINAPGYTDFVLLFQQNAAEDPKKTPQWAAFALNALTGDWRIQVYDKDLNLNDQTLSHAVLFGHVCGPPGSGCAPPEVTPIPGAVFLMGSVLAGGVGGMQLMRRRRNKFAA